MHRGKSFLGISILFLAIAVVFLAVTIYRYHRARREYGRIYEDTLTRLRARVRGARLETQMPS